MYLKTIHLKQFRNLKEAEFSFSKGLNIIYGENGIGKTSILEAIYFLCFTRSFKSKRDNDLVKKGNNYFQISSQWENKSGNKLVIKGNFLKTKGKKFFYDGVEIKKNSEMIGKTPLVFQSPENYIITSGGSKFKRIYFDKLLSQISKEYLSDLLNYAKLSKQRNAYLKILAKKKQFYSDKQIDVYNEQILPLMWRIFSKRKSIIKQFNTKFKLLFKNIVTEKLEVKIEYNPSISGESFDQFSENYKTKVNDNISKEIALHHSLYGVNYDRVNFYRDRTLLENFASQGEHKLWMNIMKLTEGNIIEENKDRVPIYLFDDVFSELDVSNSRKIIKKIRSKQQVIVTATDLNDLQALGVDTGASDVNIIHLKQE
ncbi:MAG: DNA replication and repair protein RecF [Candidatus Marinimicrobia bacterium]|nr:DNA replication and repair protein RecF [Candidatus Neomarinimicrobiota bacterium]